MLAQYRVAVVYRSDDRRAHRAAVARRRVPAALAIVLTGFLAVGAAATLSRAPGHAGEVPPQPLAAPAPVAG